MLFVSPFLVALLLWYYCRRIAVERARMMVKRTFVSVPLAAVMLGVLFYAFNQFDNLSSARVPALLDRALTEPQNFGTVYAYRNAVGGNARGAPNLPSGGWAVRLLESDQHGPVPGRRATGTPHAIRAAARSGESGEDARVTLATSLAVEFGVPAFMVLACLYLVVLVTDSLHGGSFSRTGSFAVTPLSPCRRWCCCWRWEHSACSDRSRRCRSRGR